MCAAAVPVIGSGRRVGAEKDGTWPVIAKQYDAHSLPDEPNPPPQPGLGFGEINVGQASGILATVRRRTA